MEKTWVVYKHTNLINGKSYIGITSRTNPLIRWKNGEGYRTQPKFYRAIKKYGWNGFSHSLLFVELAKEEAFSKERELIKTFDCIENGYNTQEGENQIILVSSREREQKKLG